VKEAHDPAERAAGFLEPYVNEVVDSLPDEFTTLQYLQAFRETDERLVAYEAALAAYGDDRRLALSSVHGLIAPRLLRQSRRVEWLGFAGGMSDESDGFHVPSRWRKRK
jgi:hypothetical protein